MTFIDTVPEDQATGAVAAMYETDRQTFGHLPNLTKAFSPRPDVYASWGQLNGAIKGNMDLRRYGLATVGAARRLRSSYCCLAHGSVLLDKFLSADGVRAVIDDHDVAELDAVDAAVIELADKVAHDATSVTQADVDQLRSLGLADTEILDIVLAAAVRCFFSRALDGLGAVIARVAVRQRFAKAVEACCDPISAPKAAPGGSVREARGSKRRLRRAAFLPAPGSWFGAPG